MARFHATVDGPVPFSPEEEALRDAEEAGWANTETQRLADGVRQQRNLLLAESDWTQVIDAPVNKDVWAAYRQSLRDTTKQSGFPVNLEWPVKP